jgi:hypothetical protein
VTIAAELKNRHAYLSDHRVRWVQTVPVGPRQACLLDNGDPLGSQDSNPALSDEATAFLDWFVGGYAELPADHPERQLDALCFNDDVARSRQDVLWMLEEAADEAKALGL